MGLSSNQARFLSLTSRQIDLEHRVQQICQRRLRLSNEMQRAARSYNDQTNDRRLFINTLGGFSSAQNNVIGPTTHDNLLDNNRYEFLTAENLYDNGYYVFANGTPLGATTTMGVIGTENVRSETPTGSTENFSGSSPYTVGQKFDANGFAYTVQSTSSAPGGTTYDDANKLPPSSDNQIGTPTVTSTASLGPASPPVTVQGTGADLVLINTDTSSGSRVQTYRRTDTTTEVTGTAAVSTDLINNITPGSQTLAGATQVRNVTELQVALASNQAIILMNDIDFANTTITSPLVASYSANIEGNGYKLKNLNINIGSGDVGIIGRYSTGTIKNLIVDDIQVTGNSGNVGTLLGYLESGTLENVSVLNSTITGAQYAGGLVGWQQNGLIQNCSTDTVVTNTNANAYSAGGIAGVSNGNINHCFTTGAITTNGNSVDCSVGGLIGVLIGGGAVSINYCYSTGAITNTGLGSAGALIGAQHDDTVTINNSYATGAVSAASGIKGGLVGGQDIGSQKTQITLNNSVWDTTKTGCASSYGAGNLISSTNTIGLTTAQMNDDVTTKARLGTGTEWNYSESGPPTFTVGDGFTEKVTKTVYEFTVTTPPTISSTIYSCVAEKFNIVYTAQNIMGPVTTFDPVAAGALSSEDLEKGLRDGSIKLAKDADAMTQDPVTVGGATYEYVDWRIQPVISDDLYESNDEAAQYLYEKVIRDVNAQDKQLQLEQTSVETEYNAITNEKEAVEKIIDTNAKNSFKYFS